MFQRRICCVFAWLCLISAVSAEGPESAEIRMQLVRQLWSTAVGTAESGPSSPVRPLVCGDLVVINEAFGIRALKLQTGRAAWPVDDADAGALLSAEGTPQAIELDAGVCLGSHWIGLVAGDVVGTRLDRERLVCLDLSADGRLAWQRRARRFRNVDRAEFAGQPIAVGGMVFVTLQSLDSTEVRIAAVDVQGALKWMAEWRDATATGNPGSVVLASSPDNRTLFACTSTGSVSAWDVASRRALWTTSLDAEFIPASESPLTLMAAESSLLILSGRHLTAFSTQTGETNWTCELPSEAESVLGVANSRVIVSGVDLTAVDLNTGRRLWEIRPVLPGAQGVGTGILNGQAILWPTRDELWTVDAVTGTVLDRQYLKALTGASGGPLTPASQPLLISEPGRLSAFAIQSWPHSQN